MSAYQDKLKTARQRAHLPSKPRWASTSALWQSVMGVVRFTLPPPVAVTAPSDPATRSPISTNYCRAEQVARANIQNIKEDLENPSRSMGLQKGGLVLSLTADHETLEGEVEWNRQCRGSFQVMKSAACSTMNLATGMHRQLPVIIHQACTHFICLPIWSPICLSICSEDGMSRYLCSCLAAYPQQGLHLSTSQTQWSCQHGY